MDSTAKRSNLGRPARQNSEKVRADLLRAAKEHFLTREFKAVSIRQIADTVGVNGAMVNYYFGSKQGLYIAMVDELLADLEQSLRQQGESPSLTVTEFSHNYCKLLADNPWWPNFLIREVLFSEGEIREAVVKKFSKVFAPQLLGSISKEINAGSFRQDLDPTLTLLSLLGMTIFPFLAKPLIEDVFNFSMDDDTAVTLAAHNTKLFLEGVQATASRGDKE